jgi:hypothetical protein
MPRAQFEKVVGAALGACQQGDAIAMGATKGAKGATLKGATLRNHSLLRAAAEICWSRRLIRSK